MRARLKQFLPWILPALLCTMLLLLNRGHDLVEWQVADVEMRRCEGSASTWKSAALPVSVYDDCRLFRYVSPASTSGWGTAALSLGGLTRDARVYVNGELLRDFSASRWRAFTSSLEVVSIPARLLNVRDNEILLHLHSNDFAGDYTSLHSLGFGPERILGAAANRAFWIGRGGALLAMTLIFALMLFLVPIVWSRRREVLYPWFLLSLAASAIYIANFALTWRPGPLLVWGIFTHMALAGAVWALTKFSHRFAEGQVPRHETLIGFVLLVATVMFVCTALPRLPSLLIFAFALAFRLSLLGVLGYLMHYWWRLRAIPTTPSPIWFSVAMGLIALLGLVDSIKATASSTPLLSYTLHWGILYLLMLMFAALAMRILHALGAAEESKAVLSLSLAQRSAELESEFLRRREAEQARTIAEERHRIMRDMHDGVGGQLVALIGQAQSHQLSDDELEWQLRRTLDDLRLMIDSLDEACADLSVALGMFRQRMEPALARLPIQMRWETAHLPDLPPVSPSVVLHVLRIVQEAITNALKHSGSTSLLMAADWQAPLLSLRVVDQGVAMGDPDSWNRGRGLTFMRERARSIGAQLRVEREGSGTRVVLQLCIAEPVDEASEVHEKAD